VSQLRTRLEQEQTTNKHEEQRVRQQACLQQHCTACAWGSALQCYAAAVVLRRQGAQVGSKHSSVYAKSSCAGDPLRAHSTIQLERVTCLRVCCSKL